ncbi:hypothetical protein Goshw_018168 [Gossypium schwendimanii]|uniref:Uncharacterized protein n=1 Tax=Gossypium schwendimanii TaxID=34291 RepID=A0A7J9MC99_GOSSC|nr:hypothetical protein [Gossypium schwendimanii]
MACTVLLEGFIKGQHHLLLEWF